MKHAVILSLTCLLLAQQSINSSAAGLGRLFYTPAQRQMLDKGEAANALPIQTLTQTVGQSWRLDGITRRSGRPATAWINDEPLTLGEEMDGVTVIAIGSSVWLRLPSGERVSLKPGQAVQNGLVVDEVPRVNTK